LGLAAIKAGADNHVQRFCQQNQTILLQAIVLLIDSCEKAINLTMPM
jgi:hypothetical protein